MVNGKNDPQGIVGAASRIVSKKTEKFFLCFFFCFSSFLAFCWSAYHACQSIKQSHLFVVVCDGKASLNPHKSYNEKKCVDQFLSFTIGHVRRFYINCISRRIIGQTYPLLCVLQYKYFGGESFFLLFIMYVSTFLHALYLYLCMWRKFEKHVL